MMFSHFSHVQLFATLWTVAYQTPLSMGFPGKNTGVGCHFLLRGISLTQGSNLCLLCLLHWQAQFFTTSTTWEAPPTFNSPNSMGWFLYLELKTTCSRSQEDTFPLPEENMWEKERKGEVKKERERNVDLDSNLMDEGWTGVLWGTPWGWERLKAGGERDDRGWDGWMASLTQWTWVWVDSGSWWWTGRPGLLRFMGLQRVWHDWVTELNWTGKTVIRCTKTIQSEGLEIWPLGKNRGWRPRHPIPELVLEYAKAQWDGLLLLAHKFTVGPPQFNLEAVPSLLFLKKNFFLLLIF